jgi:plasmid stability protein
MNGRSMAAEAREILRTAFSAEPFGPGDLAEAIQAPGEP